MRKLATYTGIKTTNSLGQSLVTGEKYLAELAFGNLFLVYPYQKSLKYFVIHKDYLVFEENEENNKNVLTQTVSDV